MGIVMVERISCPRIQTKMRKGDHVWLVGCGTTNVYVELFGVPLCLHFLELEVHGFGDC